MKLKFLFIFLLFTLLFSCGNDENGTANKKQIPKDTLSKRPKEKIKDGLVEGVELFRNSTSKTPFDDSYGRSGDTLFFCSRKGVIYIADTLNIQRRKILDLKAEFMVDKVFIIPREGNKWFVVWQETDHEGVISYMAVYSTLNDKADWKLSFRVPNPGKPVVDGDAAYISTLGMVGKVSLSNGSFIWKHDSLFNQNHLPYQKIEKARVYPNKVVFVDYPIPGRRERRDTLVLDPISGERKK